MHKVAPIPFEDYRTLLCLKQTASEKGLNIDEVKLEAVKVYLLDKVGLSKEKVAEVTFRGKRLHAEMKRIAQERGLLVSQIVEEAYRDYAGITSSINYTVKTQKKGSFFDLNRDVRK